MPARLSEPALCVNRSLETVSLDLLDALADLEDLQEALSSPSLVKADDNAELADVASKFMKGLSAIHLVCNTGQASHFIAWLQPDCSDLPDFALRLITWQLCPSMPCLLICLLLTHLLCKSLQSLKKHVPRFYCLTLSMGCWWQREQP